MTGRAVHLARLAAGSYTPFLAAYWDEEEWELVHRWRTGDELADEASELARTLTAPFGEGWRGCGANLGRSGIQLVLEALDLPPGSEVLLPSYSCAGVIVPVLQAGLAPVLVDVDKELNTRFASVLEADSSDVRAVIVPHLGGLWARDAEAIFAWARERRVAVIEDVAQAQGLSHAGRPAGTFGDAAVFSFGGGKLLFGPGGGLVVTRNSTLAASVDARALPGEPRTSVSHRVERFCDLFAVSAKRRARRALGEAAAARLRRGAAQAQPGGSDDPHRFDVLALSGVEAALARAQLRKLEVIIAARTANAAAWRGRLEGLRGVRLSPAGDNVFTKLWVACDDVSGAARADRIRHALHREGVETETLYVPLHRRPEFAQCRTAALPMTEALWRSVFAVPARPGLGAEDWARIDRAIGQLRVASAA